MWLRWPQTCGLLHLELIESKLHARQHVLWVIALPCGGLISEEIQGALQLLWTETRASAVLIQLVILTSKTALDNAAWLQAAAPQMVGSADDALEQSALGSTGAGQVPHHHLLSPAVHLAVAENDRSSPTSASVLAADLGRLAAASEGWNRHKEQHKGKWLPPLPGWMCGVVWDLPFAPAGPAWAAGELNPPHDVELKWAKLAVHPRCRRESAQVQAVRDQQLAVTWNGEQDWYTPLQHAWGLPFVFLTGGLVSSPETMDDAR